MSSRAETRLFSLVSGTPPDVCASNRCAQVLPGVKRACREVSGASGGRQGSFRSDERLR